jgi:hypothetical protein
MSMNASCPLAPAKLPASKILFISHVFQVSCSHARMQAISLEFTGFEDFQNPDKKGCPRQAKRPGAARCLTTSK